jgi:hypothetical protein
MKLERKMESTASAYQMCVDPWKQNHTASLICGMDLRPECRFSPVNYKYFQKTETTLNLQLSYDTSFS